jgi:hypothetical protein
LNQVQNKFLQVMLVTWWIKEAKEVK